MQVFCRGLFPKTCKLFFFFLVFTLFSFSVSAATYWTNTRGELSINLFDQNFSDTNASTVCRGSEYLGGDGSCYNVTSVADTDSNASTACGAGEFLQGDGSCVDYSGWSTGVHTNASSLHTNLTQSDIEGFGFYTTIYNETAWVTAQSFLTAEVDPSVTPHTNVTNVELQAFNETLLITPHTNASFTDTDTWWALDYNYLINLSGLLSVNLTTLQAFNDTALITPHTNATSQLLTNTTLVTHVQNLTDSDLFNQSDEVAALNATITPHTNLTNDELQPFNESANITALAGEIDAVNTSVNSWFLRKDQTGTITGSLTVLGNFSVIGVQVDLNVTNTKVNGSFLPSITNFFDIGSGTFLWRNGLFGGDLNASGRVCSGALCITPHTNVTQSPHTNLSNTDLQLFNKTHTNRTDAEIRTIASEFNETLLVTPHTNLSESDLQDYNESLLITLHTNLSGTDLQPYNQSDEISALNITITPHTNATQSPHTNLSSDDLQSFNKTHTNLTYSDILDFGFSGNCSVTGSCSDSIYGDGLINQHDLWINGSLFIFGNITSVDVSETSMNGSWFPAVDNLFNLGKTNLRWSTVYAANLIGELDCSNVTGATSDLCTLTVSPHTNRTDVEIRTIASEFNETLLITPHTNATVTPHTNLSEADLQAYNESSLITPHTNASTSPHTNKTDAEIRTIASEFNETLLVTPHTNVTNVELQAFNETLLITPHTNASGTGDRWDLDETWLINSSGNVTINQSTMQSFNQTLTNLTDDDIAGMGYRKIDQYVNTTSSPTFQNITANGYFSGQPLDGSLGSSVIYAGQIDSDAKVNISCDGLTCTYPDLVVRLQQSDNTIKYCNLTSDSIVLTDDTHNVVYVDNDCAVQKTTFAIYITTDVSPGGIQDIFNVLVSDGGVETISGVTVESRINIKVRKLILKLSHLTVLSGMGRTEETFPNITIGFGEYVYLRSTAIASEQNNSAGEGFHFVYRDSGVWVHDEQTGLNLTHCDDGSDLVECSSPSSYRRYFMCTNGFEDGSDTTTLHQMAASETVTHSNLANCLDTEVSPLVYDLPPQFVYSCALTYAYCGRAKDDSWTGRFIDLRKTKVGSATGISESDPLSVHKDGSVPLTSNWDAEYNISGGWFLGAFDWQIATLSNEWLYFNGTHLGLNLTTAGREWNQSDEILALNATITPHTNTTKVTYVQNLSDAQDFNITGNETDWVKSQNYQVAGIENSSWHTNSTVVDTNVLTDEDFNSTQMESDGESKLGIVIAWIEGLINDLIGGNNFQTAGIENSSYHTNATVTPHTNASVTPHTNLSGADLQPFNQSDEITALNITITPHTNATVTPHTNLTSDDIISLIPPYTNLTEADVLGLLPPYTNRTDAEIRIIGQEFNETLLITPHTNATVTPHTNLSNDDLQGFNQTLTNTTLITHVQNLTDAQDFNQTLMIEAVNATVTPHTNLSEADLQAYNETLLITPHTNTTITPHTNVTNDELQAFNETSLITPHTNASTSPHTNLSEANLQAYNETLLITPHTNASTSPHTNLSNDDLQPFNKTHTNLTASDILDLGFSGNCSVAGSCTSNLYLDYIMNKGDLWLNGSLFIAGNITSVDINEITLNFSGDINASGRICSGTECITPHTNASLSPHTNATVTPHTNLSETDLQAYNETSLITPHTNASTSPHTNLSETYLQAYNESLLITPHTNASTSPHTNATVTPHTNLTDGDITTFGYIKSFVDTNVTTICRGNELLIGAGNCLNFSVINYTGGTPHTNLTITDLETWGFVNKTFNETQWVKDQDYVEQGEIVINDSSAHTNRTDAEIRTIATEFNETLLITPHTNASVTPHTNRTDAQILDLTQVFNQTLTNVTLVQILTDSDLFNQTTLVKLVNSSLFGLISPHTNASGSSVHTNLTKTDLFTWEFLNATNASQFVSQGEIVINNTSPHTNVTDTNVLTDSDFNSTQLESDGESKLGIVIAWITGLINDLVGANNFQEAGIENSTYHTNTTDTNTYLNDTCPAGESFHMINGTDFQCLSVSGTLHTNVTLVQVLLDAQQFNQSGNFTPHTNTTLVTHVQNLTDAQLFNNSITDTWWGLNNIWIINLSSVLALNESTLQGFNQSSAIVALNTSLGGEVDAVNNSISPHTNASFIDTNASSACTFATEFLSGTGVCVNSSSLETRWLIDNLWLINVSGSLAFNQTTLDNFNQSDEITALNVTITPHTNVTLVQVLSDAQSFNQTLMVEAVNLTITPYTNATDTNCNASGACSQGGVAYMNYANAGNFTMTGTLNSTNITTYAGFQHCFDADCNSTMYNNGSGLIIRG